ncbi:LEA14-like dessication related protein [Candidatus Electrothrix marina]|uniref:LEA14-like dessication related protein n=1 Tax=Candidatus Electrothrix marina TaxID=1859130 RepID=A0A3S4TFA1_9BACT|nr:LEA14-like dessication related protein [Candidatus Electrothrix marina]RWX49217.1 LEA14-like dessication related protein [Candidatus Electrothrix marina]RWX50653.1 LEA14-like dessication related protein [Candidatus Electrothrix marina]
MKQSLLSTSFFAAGSRCCSGLMMLFLCCLPLLLTGCPATQSLPWDTKEDLQIALSDIELQEIKALETIFLLKLRVVNPNDTATEIRSMKCDLKINGEPFASGLSDERQGIPPFGTVSVPVVVYTSKFAIVGSVIELLQKDVQQYGGRPEEPLNYELDGQLHLGEDGKEVLPYHVAGKIVLNR